MLVEGDRQGLKQLEGFLLLLLRMKEKGLGVIAAILDVYLAEKEALYKSIMGVVWLKPNLMRKN